MICNKCNGTGTVFTLYLKYRFHWSCVPPRDPTEPGVYVVELTCPVCHGDKRILPPVIKEEKIDEISPYMYR